MKSNEGKYRVVNRLPTSAKLVKMYAADRNMSVSAIYKKVIRGKADFEIVIFDERNYIIPKN